ncbi:MAG: sodium ion-translocating decarboxylase subunit beta [Spirochaetales bacterium]|uniref:Sodium ion-translocating decarboxylase subunit beta n=1 Tax=Candidatus Thalassospirochaeta sargassi TaxID=3119039 RepID=A0AAJ1MJY6_9SPIO|nr:sodium ion-translocating decarboxylase subunit beta [Spirochaetales bacterium]
MSFFDLFASFLDSTAFQALTWQNLVMMGVGGLLIYLAIAKQYEPLLLIPIGFGAILVNLPMTGILDEGGLLYYFYYGVKIGIFPPIIFMGIGAMTDFGPLLGKPQTFLLGAAAQLGIFATLLGAKALGTIPFLAAHDLGFNFAEACSIAIIGGADGPTAIYLTSKLASHLLGPIAVAAYTYMALVPIIQPPIIRALTSKEERLIRMADPKPVSKRTKIIFPIVTTIVTALLIPASAPLIGMLMLGNLFKECGVTERLSKTAQNELINIVTIFLGISVGSKMQAEHFLNFQTIFIIVLGCIAFGIGTGGGVLLGKLMSKLSGGKINPMIGAAGVSAVPMAARVVQKVGQEEDPGNFLLMNAMGPNVAGVIGSAIAAGVLLSLN